MEQQDLSPIKKALRINLDTSIYGTFAEIGAGQDVARHFFVAGKASQTVAKSMSAYDMVFSDAIYGKSGRYVSQERLGKMLNHEFELLQERLHERRGQETRFFAFADTVATHQDLAKCHGWMGLKFQMRASGAVNRIVLHVRLLDRFRLQQSEALGILGVNLIHASFYHANSPEEFLRALTDHVQAQRIEIDMIAFDGPDLEHFDNRLLSLELVRRGLTDAVMFGPDGQMLQPSDALFKKQICVHRGTFRPVTNTNVQILEYGLEHMKKDWAQGESQVLFEMTLHDLKCDGQFDIKDFLQRVDTLSTLGHPVLISNFFLFYELKGFLRRHTDQPIGMVIGASHLQKLLDPQYYKQLPGGMLEGFSRLFDDMTRLYVYPFKSAELCTTAKAFHPEPAFRYLYQHLLAQQSIVDIAGCDDVDTSLHSQAVRDMLNAGNPKWEELVPPRVRQRIKDQQLFGYRPG